MKEGAMEEEEEGGKGEGKEALKAKPPSRLCRLSPPLEERLPAFPLVGLSE